MTCVVHFGFTQYIQHASLFLCKDFTLAKSINSNKLISLSAKMVTVSQSFIMNLPTKIWYIHININHIYKKENRYWHNESETA